jgi:hypothetical protein
MLCRSFIYHLYFRKYRHTKLSPSFWIMLYITTHELRSCYVALVNCHKNKRIHHTWQRRPTDDTRTSMFSYLHCGLVVYLLEVSFPNSGASTPTMAESTNIWASAAYNSTTKKLYQAPRINPCFQVLTACNSAVFLYLYGSPLSSKWSQNVLSVKHIHLQALNLLCSPIHMTE